MLGEAGRRSVEWHLFARGIFAMASHEMGLVCAILGMTRAGEVLIVAGMGVSGVALIVAASHQYRRLRDVATVADT